ncbi:hypothetical protein D3Z52_06310 [Clostridiaceae bacterium]|nr:hypothetical protein [Clostridiaceae bacterium]
MTVRACAAGGRALPCTRRGSAPAPPRLRGERQGSALHPAGLCPCTPRLRGERQGSALHPAGLRPCTPRLRGERQGSALHPAGLRPCTPLGLCPRPRDADASLSRLRAGRGLGHSKSFLLSDAARQNGGGPRRLSSLQNTFM